MLHIWEHVTLGSMGVVIVAWPRISETTLGLTFLDSSRWTRRQRVYSYALAGHDPDMQAEGRRVFNLAHLYAIPQHLRIRTPYSDGRFGFSRNFKKQCHEGYCLIYEGHRVRLTR
jgi:hypothetical protein